MAVDNFIRRFARWLAAGSLAALAACGGNVQTPSGGDVGATPPVVLEQQPVVEQTPVVEQPAVGSAPVITEHPQNVTATAGTNASFTVQASGTPTGYQWQRNGVDIDGATAASYTTGALALGDGGAIYTVVVRNEHGSATSNNASLGVRAATRVDIEKLVRFLMLSFEFYDAATAPLQVIEEVDGQFVFADPASLCFSGVATSNWDGTAIVPGQAVPLTGTLAGAFDHCNAGNASYHGSGVYSVTLASVEPLDVTLGAAVNSMNRRVLVGGAVDTDVTVDGNASLRLQGTSDPFSFDVSVGVDAGATLIDNVEGLAALYHGGAIGVRVADTACGGFSLRLSFDDLSIAIAGVLYEATGAFQIDGDGAGQYTHSGQIVFSTDGVVVARIYGDDQGQIVVWVDGVETPTRNPAIARAPKREKALGAAEQPACTG